MSNYSFKLQEEEIYKIGLTFQPELLKQGVAAGSLVPRDLNPTDH